MRVDTRGEWGAQAGDDAELRAVMVRLHSLFANADSLGSLITPRPSDLGGALFSRDGNVGASWESVRSALAKVLLTENLGQTVLGHATDDIVHAARLLAGQYTLAATNPPYLQRNNMDDRLGSYLDSHHPTSKNELATASLSAAWTLSE